MSTENTQDTIVRSGSRLIFVGGKGGVGKTTTAAALALSLASKSSDHQVMIISTDPAHSLSDSFGQHVGNKLTQIRGLPVVAYSLSGGRATSDERRATIYAQELDAGSLLDKFKSENEAEIKLLAERGTYFDSDDIQSFFRLSFPGIDEVMSVLEIGRLLKDDNIKHLIVDTAPTGHTLSLLRLPVLLETWIDIFDLLQEKHHILQRHFSGKVIKDNVDNFIEVMRSNIRDVRNIIQDRNKSQFIVVMLPEMLSLFESNRLIGTLKKQGIPLRSLVLNGIQNSGDCVVCKAVREKQEKVISLLKGNFTGLNIYQVPLSTHSIQGLKGLEWFSSYLVSREAYLVSREAYLVNREAYLEVEKTIIAKHETRDTRYEIRDTRYEIRATRKASLSKLLKGSPKLIIVGGKGGVGKTTVSCCTSLMMAAREPSKKFLTFSIDPAHSLSDCLGVKIESREARVCENLYASELNAKLLLDDFKKEYTDTIDNLFDKFFQGSTSSAGMNFSHDRKVVKALIEMTPPGLDELMALYQVINLIKGTVKYDAIVFDTAPSGHLFRFLELPHLVREWLKAIFQLLIKYKQAISLGPAAEKLVGLSKNIREIIEIMQDEASCRTIVVSTPEAMVVSETKRFVKNLERLDVPMSLLVINMLRENTECDYCREIGRGQEDMLVELKKMVPKEWASIPYLPEDIRGIEKLKELGKMMYCIS